MSIGLSRRKNEQRTTNNQHNQKNVRYRKTNINQTSSQFRIGRINGLVGWMKDLLIVSNI